MTLQASAPISLANIVTEFGGAAPHSLSEYVRGGAYVPNVSQNNAVSTSASGLKISQFYSTTKFVVADNIPNASDYSFGQFASASLRLNNDASCSIYQQNNGGWGTVGSWALPTGGTPGAGYWVYATKTDGNATPPFNMGSWIQISSAPSWGISTTAPEFDPTNNWCTLALKISTTASDAGLIYTASVDINAYAEGNV